MSLKSSLVSTKYLMPRLNASKKDGGVLPIFLLKINDPTEAEALISQNLVCQVTDIVYEVEESPVSVTQCFNCQSLCHSAKTVGQNINVLSVVRIILIKDVCIKKQGAKQIRHLLSQPNSSLNS